MSINTSKGETNMARTITIKHFHVNSKILAAEIEDFVLDGLNTIPSLLSDEAYREMICDTLSELLQEMKDKNQVDNFKIVGDKRNNTKNDLDKGIYHLDIHYQQHHCINTTILSYCSKG